MPIRALTLTVLALLFGGGGWIAAGGQPPERPPSKLPEPPDGFYPTRVAAKGMTAILGAYHRRIDPSAPEFRHEQQVEIEPFRSWLGGTPLDRKVSITWEPLMHPVIESKEHEKSTSLIVLDEESRLLAAIERDDSVWVDGGPALGTLGTSRLPSKRFHQRELEWAWLGIDRDFQNHDRATVVLRKWRKGELPLGQLELSLRFESLENKIEILKGMRSGRTLTSDELEIVEIALWDLHTSVKTEAAHLLLDSGRRVQPELIQECLGPLIRLDDAGAKQELVKMFTDKSWGSTKEDPRSAWTRAREQSAYDTPNMPPYLREPLLERLQDGRFAWLNESASADDLRQVLGFLWQLEIVRFEPLEHWRALVAQALVDADEDQERLVDDYGALARLGHLASELPEAAREQPEFRDSVRRLLEMESTIDGSQRIHLLAVAAAAGDAQSLTSLRSLAKSRRIGLHEEQFVIRTIGKLPRDEVVDLLCYWILNPVELEGMDCTSASWHTVLMAAEALRSREEKDREHALQLLGDRSAQNFDLLVIRVALGARPTLVELQEMNYSHELLSHCKWNTADYADSISDLRADPVKHCIALGMLRDRASAWALGESVLEASRNLPKDGVRYSKLLWAIEKIGSGDALPWLYPTLRTVPKNRLDSVLQVIGALENADGIHRLVPLCLDEDPALALAARRVLFVALGRLSAH